jgi:hypothetical protein
MKGLIAVLICGALGVPSVTMADDDNTSACGAVLCLAGLMDGGSGGGQCNQYERDYFSIVRYPLSRVFRPDKLSLVAAGISPVASTTGGGLFRTRRFHVGVRTQGIRDGADRKEVVWGKCSASPYARIVGIRLRRGDRPVKTQEQRHVHGRRGRRG